MEMKSGARCGSGGREFAEMGGEEFQTDSTLLRKRRNRMTTQSKPGGLVRSRGASYHSLLSLELSGYFLSQLQLLQLSSRQGRGFCPKKVTVQKTWTTYKKLSRHRRTCAWDQAGSALDKA